MMRPARQSGSSISTRMVSSSGRRRGSSALPETLSKRHACCCCPKSSKFPNGLANSSGQVGRNYMRHMTGSVYAVFDKPVRMWRGTTMAGIVTDEAANNPQRGFVGGFEMETLSIGLPFMAAFLDPGAWGREFTSALDGYENMSGMWLVGEDMPQESNRVTLDAAAKDKWGLAVANVHFDDHQNDITMRKYAHKAGSAVYEAVGATRTSQLRPIPQPTISAPAGCRRTRATASATSSAKLTMSGTYSSPTAASSPLAAPKIQL